MEENVKKKGLSFSIIMLIGAIIIVILAGIFIAKPIYEDNSEKQEIIKIKKINSEILEDKEEKLENIALEYGEESIKQDVEKVKSALPEYKDRSRLFNQFEGIAYSSGLWLKSASEGTSKKKKRNAKESSKTTIAGVSRVDYNLVVVGNSESILNFFTNTQKALRVLIINSIYYKGTEGNDLEITVDLSAFYKSEGSEESNETN